MNKEKLEEHLKARLKEAMELCRELEILGINTSIDCYYVKFNFEKLRQKCTQCGQVIE